MCWAVLSASHRLIFVFSATGLTEPVLIRLDVDTKLSDQLKVKIHILLKSAFDFTRHAEIREM